MSQSTCCVPVAVRWAAGLGAITAEALARRCGVEVPRARGVLIAATRAGLLARSRVLDGQPVLYAITASGLRRVGLSRLGPCRVSASNARHLMDCAAVAAAMERRHPDHRVEGERELRWQEHDASRALASARLGMAPDGGPRLHRPDLVLWPVGDPAPTAGAPVAVEVELTVKAPRRLLGICRAWARCQMIGGVVYVAPPDAARALERAVAEVHGGERIVVVGLESVLG